MFCLSAEEAKLLASLATHNSPAAGPSPEAAIIRQLAGIIERLTNKPTVFIACYEHRHGDDIRLFAQESDAEAWRVSLARMYFASEIGEEPPADDTECADRYFDYMNERDKGEWFTVETGQIEGSFECEDLGQQAAEAGAQSGDDDDLAMPNPPPGA